MKVDAWFIDLSVIETHKHRQIPTLCWYQKMWNPCYKYMQGIQKEEDITPTSTKTLVPPCGAW